MKLLIVFSCNKGTGNLVIKRDSFPCSGDDIREIEDYIMEEANVEGVIITNIVKLG